MVVNLNRRCAIFLQPCWVTSATRGGVFTDRLLYQTCIFTASSTPVVHSAKVRTHLNFVARFLSLCVLAARTQNIVRQLRNSGFLCRRLSVCIACRFLCGDRLRPYSWCRTVRCPPLRSSCFLMAPPLPRKRFLSRMYRFSSLARSLIVLVRACFVKLFFCFNKTILVRYSDKLLFTLPFSERFECFKCPCLFTGLVHRNGLLPLIPSMLASSSRRSPFEASQRTPGGFH